MRRALLTELPALTRFTYGALNPLTIGDYTLAEINEYLTQLRQYVAEERRSNRGR